MLPACDAVTTQSPAPVMCTVVPVSVQVPVALNETVRPDDAVAETSKSESPYVTPVGGVNVIVCAAGTTEWPLSA